MQARSVCSPSVQWWNALVVAGVAGCGRFGFDPRQVREVLDSPSVDAPIDAPSCTFGAWSAAGSLTALNSPQSDFGSQISADGLALYWQTNGDIHSSHRATRTAPWGAIATYPELLIAGGPDVDTSIRLGELEIYLSDTNNQCTYRATRATTADAWSIPAMVGTCDANKAVGPDVSLDGLTLYYSDTSGTNALGKLLASQRATTADDFTPGSQLPGIVDDGQKGWPFVTADGLALYYEGGYMGNAGTHRMFVATRSAASQPFGTPVLVPGLDSPANGNEEDLSLTEDQLEIFFSTEAPGGAGGFDLYSATRTCD